MSYFKINKNNHRIFAILLVSLFLLFLFIIIYRLKINREWEVYDSSKGWEKINFCATQKKIDAKTSEIKIRGHFKGNKFYEVVFDLSVRGNESYNYKISTLPSSDINSSRIYLKGKLKSRENIRVVQKSNQQGIINISIKLENRPLGRVKISELSCSEISSADDIDIYESKDKSVRIITKKEDLPAISHTNVIKLLNLYSRLRNDMVTLSGGREPYNGKTTFICTYDLGEYYGLAGDPIYINRRELESIFRTINKNDWDAKSKIDVVWPLLHEMSHTFDGISGSNQPKYLLFDKEFWADYKMAIVLNKNHLPIYVDSQKYEIGDYYDQYSFASKAIYDEKSLVSLVIDFESENNIDSFDQAEKILKNRYTNTDRALSSGTNPSLQVEFFLSQIKGKNGENCWASLDPLTREKIINGVNGNAIILD